MITPDAAAWIRANAWTASMRKTHASAPAYYATCDCQSGPSSYCAAGQHKKCDHHADTPRPPNSETWICDDRSMVLNFHGWHYRNPTPGLTGSWRHSEAMVWLADRACRWRCPCDCHPRDIPSGPIGSQLVLFGPAPAAARRTKPRPPCDRPASTHSPERPPRDDPRAPAPRKRSRGRATTAPRNG